MALTKIFQRFTSGLNRRGFDRSYHIQSNHLENEYFSQAAPIDYMELEGWALCAYSKSQTGVDAPLRWLISLYVKCMIMMDKG